MSPTDFYQIIKNDRFHCVSHKILIHGRDSNGEASHLIDDIAFNIVVIFSFHFSLLCISICIGIAGERKKKP